MSARSLGSITRVDINLTENDEGTLYEGNFDINGDFETAAHMVGLASLRSPERRRFLYAAVCHMQYADGAIDEAALEELLQVISDGFHVDLTDLMGIN